MNVTLKVTVWAANFHEPNEFHIRKSQSSASWMYSVEKWNQQVAGET